MAQSPSADILSTVVVTGRPDSLTQSDIDSTKDNGKAISDGAPIVELNNCKSEILSHS